ncbi:MAG: 50S ribosomal protein L9 [Clostridia bacterium]|nr:50S ribosomal protein L9 [Clostridia bacterium]
MKIVLLEDVKSLGKRGELVNAADGYAKNFLFPRKLAKPADAAALNEIKNREASQRHRIAVETAEAQKNAEALEGRTVRVSARSGQNGKLFGSVTTKDISEAVKASLGLDIDKKNLSCDDIRSYGTFEVTAKLYTGISASFYVLVGE